MPLQMIYQSLSWLEGHIPLANDRTDHLNGQHDIRWLNKSRTIPQCVNVGKNAPAVFKLSWKMNNKIFVCIFGHHLAVEQVLLRHAGQRDTTEAVDV